MCLFPQDVFFFIISSASKIPSFLCWPLKKNSPMSSSSQFVGSSVRQSWLVLLFVPIQETGKPSPLSSASDHLHRGWEAIASSPRVVFVHRRCEAVVRRQGRSSPGLWSSRRPVPSSSPSCRLISFSALFWWCSRDRKSQTLSRRYQGRKIFRYF